MSSFAVILSCYLIWLFGMEMFKIVPMAARLKWDTAQTVGAVIGLVIRNGIIFACLGLGGFYK